MHDDLRRRALESKKTTSRKAASRLSLPSSPSSSRAASRAGSANTSRLPSRTASRAASDIDDTSEVGDWSDDVASDWGTASIDDILSGGEDGASAARYIWTDELDSRIEGICERKGRSAQGREQDMRVYTQLLRQHYAPQLIAPRVERIVPALLRSVKSGGAVADPSAGENAEGIAEGMAALQALAVTALTLPSSTPYDATTTPLLDALQSSPALVLKPPLTALLALLAIATPDAGEDDVEVLMSTLLDIVSSDGADASAPDHAPTVAAAINAWALLATTLDTLEDVTSDALDAFAEQLDAASPTVQLAAGEAVALLFERSRTEREADDSPPPSPKDETDADADANPAGRNLVSRYVPAGTSAAASGAELAGRLRGLANVSAKRVGKKERKTLHALFGDVLQTVEYPGRGPQYSAALDEDSGRHYGHRMAVGVGGGRKVRIETWARYMRVKAVRGALGDGWGVHYLADGVVGRLVDDV
ncbi:hypothetical protein MRB53_037417 [Persea americana]|nr:hypothetical protein MRB53_037417 [Persea americana]